MRSSSLFDLDRNERSKIPALPKHAINASSSAALAVGALPLFESAPPNNFRQWQSMTKPWSARRHGPADAALASSAAFVRCGRPPRGRCLNTRPNGSIGRLPAHKLGGRLNGFLFEAQEVYRRTIVQRGVIVGHLLSPIGKMFLRLQFSFKWRVADRDVSNTGTNDRIWSSERFIRLLSTPAGPEASYLARLGQQGVRFFLAHTSNNIASQYAAGNALSCDSRY